jgi:hypothetical protein
VEYTTDLGIKELWQSGHFVLESRMANDTSHNSDTFPLPYRAIQTYSLNQYLPCDEPSADPVSVNREAHAPILTLLHTSLKPCSIACDTVQPQHASRIVPYRLHPPGVDSNKGGVGERMDTRTSPDRRILTPHIRPSNPTPSYCAPVGVCTFFGTTGR